MQKDVYKYNIVERESKKCILFHSHRDIIQVNKRIPKRENLGTMV